MGITERMRVDDGTWLRAQVDGPEGAPWLVLSNSLASDYAMWDLQMPLLAGRYRVLRYDTRGHGGSDVPPGPYSLDRLVADVVGIMDHHGAAQAAYMGLSLGGMTGLGLALGYPGRVERLVCCDARADAPPGFVSSWDERIAAVTAGGMDAVLAGTLDRWLVPATRAARPEAEAELARMIRGTDTVGYRGCAEALKRLDYLGSLSRITCPTLFVVGAEDTGTPAAVMQEMSARLPGSRLEVVPGAAHIANMDNPEGFARAIAPFLNSAA